VDIQLLEDATRRGKFFNPSIFASEVVKEDLTDAFATEAATQAGKAK